jgi:hypothetical protein
MPASSEVSLSIGGVTLHLVADDPRLAPATDGVLGHFLVANRAPDVEVRAHWTDTPDQPGGDLIFDSGPPWQLHRDGDDRVFTFRSELGGSIPYKTARFNATFTEGDVRVYRPHFAARPNDAINPLEYPLDELLMIHLLSQGRGVEVHGCAVLDERGRAYLFPGQSGAGKSTIATLWMQLGARCEVPGANDDQVRGTSGRERVTLLSDERVVLRTDRDPVVVFGTPWHGDARSASPLSGELAGVFFLTHAPANSITPIHGAMALAKLFSCSFLPFHGAATLDRTAHALDLIVGRTPCYTLGFVPDQSAIDALATLIFDR